MIRTGQRIYNYFAIPLSKTLRANVSCMANTISIDTWTLRTRNAQEVDAEVIRLAKLSGIVPDTTFDMLEPLSPPTGECGRLCLCGV